MLGSDYNVTNFGVSGTTVTSPEIPYFYQPKFEEAKEYLPNIAVIMLGTNDARADHFKSIDYFVADYNVTNLGVSGTTVTSPEIPYFYQPKFEEAKEYLPNIAVIMLGTNDARADHFKSIDYFVADYMELITTIQELESKPEIFLVKPPPIFENILELNNTNLVDEIIPRIEQVANDLNLPIIDVYTVLENHPEYFPDGVHPNSEAAKIIAEEVYEAITTLH